MVKKCAFCLTEFEITNPKAHRKKYCSDTCNHQATYWRNLRRSRAKARRRTLNYYYRHREEVLLRMKKKRILGGS